MKIHDIGTFEAKTKLSELLEKVQRGQVFRITKRGKPVARLISEEQETTSAKKPKAWELFQKIQKGQAKISQRELDKLVRKSREELLKRTEKLLHK